MSQPHEHDPSEAGGELNIVPFLDIIMNVLMFVLATIPAVFTATIESNPPSTGGSASRAQEKPTLNLSILITREGATLKAIGGSLGPGCEPGPGYTAAAKDGDYAWADIKACATKVKEAKPEWKEETTVQVIAEPGIDYQTVIRAMDALREDERGEPLFPDVNFGVAK